MKCVYKCEYICVYVHIYIYIYSVCIYIYIYTYTMKYNLTIKNNEIFPFTMTWIELQCIMLSEISQRKTSIIGFHHI